MATNRKCDNCNGVETAQHTVQHDNGDGVEVYCNDCWIKGGYGTVTVECPNVGDKDATGNHSCDLCDLGGVGTVTVSTCCGAPEEWLDCELTDGDTGSHAEGGCSKTVCSKCGYTLYRDCRTD